MSFTSRSAAALSLADMLPGAPNTLSAASSPCTLTLSTWSCSENAMLARAEGGCNPCMVKQSTKLERT